MGMKCNKDRGAICCFITSVGKNDSGCNLCNKDYYLFIKYLESSGKFAQQHKVSHYEE